MISFKPRKLSEDAIVEQLKKVFDHCEPDDFKSKKFRGLLYDYIPNEIGLKTRLEVMGQTGTLEKLIKQVKKKPVKIQKIAEEFSMIYGFSLDAVYDTMNLVAKSFDVPLLSVVPEQVNPLVQVVSKQGNFSKKHLENEREVARKNSVNSPKLPQQGSKKNNIWRMIQIIGFALLMCGTFVMILSRFEDYPVLIEAFKAVSQVGIGHPWFLTTIVTTIIMATVPNLLYRYKKINVPSLYPLAMLLIQLVSAALYVTLPMHYEMIQVGIWIAISLSFAAITVPAVKLSKRHADLLASKAILPYYFTAFAYFLTQYVVRRYL